MPYRGGKDDYEEIREMPDQSVDYSVVPIDREVGEWSPEKATCSVDFNKIKEEITRLEMEIKN